MSEQTLQEPKPKSIRLTTAVLLILPLLALGGVIALFLRTGGGLSFSSPAPLEDLTIERTVFKPDSIDILVRNAGREDIRIAQVIINDAVWPASTTPAAVIPRLNKAVIHLDYPWVHGEAYAITLFTTQFHSVRGRYPGGL